MYTNKDRNIYHSILDLKMGYPVTVKLEDSSYILICSSENVSDENLIWMNNISSSSLSVIINKDRMEYLSQKRSKNELYSISFSESLTGDLCYKLSCSKSSKSFTLLKNAIISFEKRHEISKIISLMKEDHIIPSLVVASVNNNMFNEHKSFFKLKNLSLLDYSELNYTLSKDNELMNCCLKLGWLEMTD